MNLFPEHIVINGKNIRVMEIIERNHSIEHENELVAFLREWYSPENYIEAGTSGSTGTPKTIRLNKNFVAKSAQRTIHYFGLKEGDRILHCLPVGFIAGKLMIVRALLKSLDLTITEPATDFSFLKNNHFRFAAMVPNQVAKILVNEPASGKWMNSIDYLLIGGSALPSSLEEKLSNLKSKCYSSYGMTETATHVALRKINGEGADGYYHCLDEIKVQLSKNGCLRIFMSGFTESPLQTSDIAELIDEKTFRILGRSDNVIISGGIKFYPEQIEKKLEPFINLPFLIAALPHESLGQQLILVIEGNESEQERKKVYEICINYLGKYELPKKILFIPHIPSTVNEKPDRKKIISLL